jgi:hypothetical protein
MGLNDEYARDAHLAEDVGPSGDDESDEPDPLSPEDWQDWHSEDLLDMWFTLKAKIEETYSRWLAAGSYNDFVEFVMEPQAWDGTTDQWESDLYDLWMDISASPLLHGATFAQFQNFVLFYS